MIVPRGESSRLTFQSNSTEGWSPLGPCNCGSGLGVPSDSLNRRFRNRASGVSSDTLPPLGLGPESRMISKPLWKVIRLRASPSLRASPEAVFFAAGQSRKGDVVMSTVSVVRHGVSDFDAWKKVYDGFASFQAEHGVRAHQVLRSLENRNEVI